ncbi:MAG TPA: hypothetical protein VGN00_19755 [Puia sp.]|jgi:hypothetical protein
MNEDYELIYPEGYVHIPPKVDPTIPDLSNDPTVLEQTERVKKLLEKVKFPPNWRDME